MMSVRLQDVAVAAAVVDFAVEKGIAIEVGFHDRSSPEGNLIHWKGKVK